MKYLLIFLALFIACNDPQPGSQEKQISFAASISLPDSVKILSSGDTLKYYHNTKINTYSYDLPYTVVVPKTSVPPIDTTTGTTSTVNFTELAITTPDLPRPEAGAEQWHSANEVNIGYIARDVYYRFPWTRLEGATQGSYNWSYIDGLINGAIVKKQKFSFGIMTLNTNGDNGVTSYDGATSCYPLYLHTLMQGESVKDFRKGNVWVPNYNSQHYLNRLLALHVALNTHLMNTSFNGVLYKDVIANIDIRGYGNWGEWHHGTVMSNVSEFPAGTRATLQTLKSIVNTHIQGFPDFQLVAMIAAFDANRLPMIMNPPEIAHYILTSKNNRGVIGWRRDQWGDTEGYLKDYLENNNVTVNGVVLKDLIMNTWKVAPITGEPPSWNPDNYSDLERQVKLYHALSFGNGNYGTSVTPLISQRVIAASKACGYRIWPSQSVIKTSLKTLNITTTWNNTGLSPAYADWFVYYDLTNSSGQVTSLKSNFIVRLFTGQKVFTDNFSDLAPGKYKLTVRIAEKFYGNMPMQTVTNQANYSLLLKTEITL